MNEDHTPDLRKGEVLCRALFLSVDPIVRLYMSYGMAPKDVIPGRQVARIIESRNRDYPKGKVCDKNSFITLISFLYFSFLISVNKWVHGMADVFSVGPRGNSRNVW